MAIVQVPGYQGHTSGPIGTVTRLVVHATVSPCVVGGARTIAAYFQKPTAGGLAHYVVDPTEVVQCAAETVATWGAPPNTGSLHVELTDPQTGDPARWNDVDHRAMLALAAPLVRDICQRHNLPLVYVNSADLLAGKRGITTHADVSAAWHQTTHTDPGVGFPMAAFLNAVNATPPHVDPPPTTGDPLMALTDKQQVDLTTDAHNAAVIASDVRNALDDPKNGVLERLVRIEDALAALAAKLP